MFQNNTKTREARGDERPMLGFVSVVCASVLSAFAGVVLEKLLKSGRHSIWVRNVQLAGVGAPMALAGAFWSDSDRIHDGRTSPRFQQPCLACRGCQCIGWLRHCCGAEVCGQHCEMLRRCVGSRHKLFGLRRNWRGPFGCTHSHHRFPRRERVVAVWSRPPILAVAWNTEETWLSRVE